METRKVPPAEALQTTHVLDLQRYFKGKACESLSNPGDLGQATNLASPQNNIT